MEPRPSTYFSKGLWSFSAIMEGRRIVLDENAGFTSKSGETSANN
jgi:hypothetical protein